MQRTQLQKIDENRNELDQSGGFLLNGAIFFKTLPFDVDVR